VYQYLFYSPFGESLYSQHAQTGEYNTPHRFNAKEFDGETGNYYYGARYYNPRVSVWLSVDRFAQKYRSLTPYHFGANNPILYIDINGDSLWIESGSNTLLYHGGDLFTKDGSRYTGEVKGFVKKVVNSLNEIRSTREGGNALEELESSSNHFSIVKGDNKFVPSDNLGAYSNQISIEDPEKFKTILNSGLDLSGGSGGTISWNSSGTILPTTKGGRVNASTDLAHELFHALDANRGFMDNRKWQGIKHNEWQAVYRENVLRSQLGAPLRTHYIKKVDGFGQFISGSGPMMITPNNNPILPSWYKP
jgi:RHS repeat-associated protein